MVPILLLFTNLGTLPTSSGIFCDWIRHEKSNQRRHNTQSGRKTRSMLTTNLSLWTNCALKNCFRFYRQSFVSTLKTNTLLSCFMLFLLLRLCYVAKIKDFYLRTNQMDNNKWWGIKSVNLQNEIFHIQCWCVRDKFSIHQFSKVEADGIYTKWLIT